MKKNQPNRNYGFLKLICLVFVALKLSNSITWSWTWVMSPMILFLVLTAIHATWQAIVNVGIKLAYEKSPCFKCQYNFNDSKKHVFCERAYCRKSSLPIIYKKNKIKHGLEKVSKLHFSKGKECVYFYDKNDPSLNQK